MPAFPRKFQGPEATADGTQRVVVDAWMRGRVAVKVPGGGLDAGEVFFGVRAENDFLRHLGWGVPF